MCVKRLLVFIFIITFLSGSFVEAGIGFNGRECFVAGSYVRTTGSTPDDAVMNQFIFNVDGTVYFNRSLSINLPIATGTFLPFVGTWKKKNNFIYVTLVTTQAGPTGSDVNVINYARSTFKIKQIDKHTLEIVFQVVKIIPLNQDPLRAEGTTVLSIPSTSIYKKVKVLFSDFPESE